MSFLCLRSESKSQTWSSNIDVHAVALNLALRRSWSNGGDAQVSSIQVLLSPLAMVRLVVSLQDRLLVDLLKEREQSKLKLAVT